MVLSEDAKWILENVVSWMIVFFGMGGMFVIFIRYLSQREKADAMRDSAILQTQKDDNQQWRDTIKAMVTDINHVMAGQKVAIEGLGLSHSELYRTMKEDRTVMMAYQNTTSTALAELLVTIKDIRGLPDALKKVQADLTGQLTKVQTAVIETESRHHLEATKNSASTNNAMLELQRSMTRVEKAIEKLPRTMQNTLTPVVAMLEKLIETAQATHNKIDDLPLDKLIEIEKDLSESIPIPPIVTPPLGEGVVVETPIDGV